MPQQLIFLFGASNESVYYMDFAVKAFRIYLCMLPLATVNKATFIFLQSLGKPWLSTFLSMLREIVLGGRLGNSIADIFPVKRSSLFHATCRRDNFCCFRYYHYNNL